MDIAGNLVDVFSREVYPARVVFDKRINKIERLKTAPGRFICPGFVDAHVHVESSMLIPTEFARAAVRHGTIGTVSDPHEIANVLGLRGITFMFRNAARTPFKFCFGVPSCVPATRFETAGARLDAKEVALLFKKGGQYLAEVMNYPDVVLREPKVMEKIAVAKKFGKRVDGHAPGLCGKALQAYVNAGIETDHECSTINEAQEKHVLGMKILVREGSAAKNLSALYRILAKDGSMLCSDDLHADDLLSGHLDALLRKCVRLGADVFDALRAATLAPVTHYGLDCGLLQEGDAADFTILENLKEFRVRETWLDGRKVFSQQSNAMPRVHEKPINVFHAKPQKPGDFAYAGPSKTLAIGVKDGSLLTKKIRASSNDWRKPESGINKIAVINRYCNCRPAVAFAKGFGLRRGAFASSVSHDSHNLCAVGADDESLAQAANAVIACKGGLAAFDGTHCRVLRLPFAGLMSGEPCEKIALEYTYLNKMVHSMGCCLRAPFMALSFTTLLSIPELKISDQGLFDSTRFEFVR